MNASQRLGPSRYAWVILLCLVTGLGAGCTAGVSAESEATYPAPVGGDVMVYDNTVPDNIEAYPQYEYQGGYVYYVGNRWYRRGPRGWGYFRQEPTELARQREIVVREGPRAPVPRVEERRPAEGRGELRERGVVEAQPPSVQVRPSVQARPPAQAPRNAPPPARHAVTPVPPVPHAR
jgi:hypothetical protein